MKYIFETGTFADGNVVFFNTSSNVTTSPTSARYLKISAIDDYGNDVSEFINSWATFNTTGGVNNQYGFWGVEIVNASGTEKCRLKGWSGSVTYLAGDNAYQFTVDDYGYYNFSDSFTNGETVFISYYGVGTQGVAEFAPVQGTQGLQGPTLTSQGTQGDNGITLSGGTQGLQGLGLTDTNQGYQGYRGEQGLQGNIGSALQQGTQGFQGIAGEDINPVYISTSDPDTVGTYDEGAIWIKIP